MNQNSLIMILIAILIVVFGVVAVVQSRKHGLKTDYRTLFILGVIWMGFGVVELTAHSPLLTAYTGRRGPMVMQLRHLASYTSAAPSRMRSSESTLR